MFGKILIANRGEIAVRVARTCRELGVATVAVYSDPDAGARHVAACDEAVHLPGVAPTDTYLNLDAVIAAAAVDGRRGRPPRATGSSPSGPTRPDAVVDAGLVWIGPPPDAAEAVGDKLRPGGSPTEAGVPVVPGTLEPASDAETVRAFGGRHG